MEDEWRVLLYVSEEDGNREITLLEDRRREAVIIKGIHVSLTLSG